MMLDRERFCFYNYSISPGSKITDSKQCDNENDAFASDSVNHSVTCETKEMTLSMFVLQ